MEKNGYGFLLILSVIASLGLMSCVSCIVAEFKKTKVKDVKLIIGNVIICGNFCSKQRGISYCKANKPLISTFLLLISWISFGIAVALISTATSMSLKQAYGTGWLDGECYLVKDGVYIGSAFLVLFTVVSILGSTLTTIRRTQVDQGSQIHQPLESKILG
ncbi:protein MODIFYING WALL LIGNIN-2 isoform X2 [Ziziphus jujuba]|uniref:Protein MODIFYING WALL LIGNIN-2 isoform X2 n=1 Tax=Ziziphus jujuba TaxID=326968 RepID=A0A6P4ALH7_ZIZJJ|nr:protein MODIFYING WALL LIGNIN-2 isoform X2 [Ziziphus jujuba]